MPEINSLTPGSRLGPYEILAQIGAGGMGEVYKARDTRLDRMVAVKVSKQEFTERFEREARAVAALNHPHICQLYDVGPNYLVMEYVEGSPVKGPLPLDKALEYAGQIAWALDTAHSNKITHRDLKPANILLTKNSGVKLLDFGLAKIEKPVTADEATLTMGLTAKGTILGTLMYMSPEQISGVEAGPRSDIFSFGLVLYEMITGKRAFEGATAASVMSAILERPAPSVADVAAPALDRVLKRCLEKDPENRWQTARDLRAGLELVAFPDAGRVGNPPQVENLPHNRLAWAITAVAVLALGVLAFFHFREAPPPELHTSRFQIPPPEKSSIDYFKLSPDGRSLTFVAAGRLWIRAFDSLEARPLAGTDGADKAFWSPDNQFVAFFAQGKLKKIAVSGGPAQVLCNVTQPFGGTWNRDGVIVLPLSLGSGLFQVSAAGGTPVRLSKSERTAPQIYPEFLPDGHHFLYSALGTPDVIFAGSLDGSPDTLLLRGALDPIYVPSTGRARQGGYLLFRQGESLMAQRFDPTQLKLSGDAVPIAERIGGDPLWAAFSVSEDGTLVSAPAAGSTEVQLVWRDRAGKQVGLFGPPGMYDRFRLSPDEKRIAFTILQSDNQDVWVLDSIRGVPSRLTFDPNVDDPPLWSSDGQRIVWASNRGGAFDLYIKSANGAGAEQLLIKMGTQTGWAEDWSQDGRFILYQIPGAKTGQDLWIAPQVPEGPGGVPKPFPYLQSEFDEQHGRFSPDGRWVAYTSNESGREEVYVQSFPLSGAKFQVSSGGGREPHWRRDGAELFYIGQDRMLTAVPVKLGRSSTESVQIGQAKPLFSLSILSTFIVERSYEVSNDGQRFLVPVIPGGASAPPLTVVLNWQTGLKK